MMLKVSHIHHIAIICSDYQRSKTFYSETLGFRIIAETYRESRESYKLDLAINANQQIELFSFPAPPERPSRPEAQGLRHLAFAVDDLDDCVAHLNRQGVATETIRMDELTGKRFTFLPTPMVCRWNCMRAKKTPTTQ